MAHWSKPMYREFTVWVPLVLVITVIIMIAIGAYYGSRAPEAMVGVVLLIYPIIGLLILCLLIKTKARPASHSQDII